MPPTETTTLQDDLITIYKAQGWRVEEWPRTITPAGRETFGLPDPLAINDAGLAEFAMVLLWAFSNRLYVDWWDGTQCKIRHGWGVEEWESANGSPQEALIRALAAAIRARDEEGKG